MPSRISSLWAPSDGNCGYRAISLALYVQRRTEVAGRTIAIAGSSLSYITQENSILSATSDVEQTTHSAVGNPKKEQ